MPKDTKILNRVGTDKDQKLRKKGFGCCVGCIAVGNPDKKLTVGDEPAIACGKSQRPIRKSLAETCPHRPLLKDKK